MIDATLIDDFIPEAFDQLEILESNIILLESGQHNEEVISVLFRAAHTIKGSSEYIGLNRIATVAHRLENLLDMVRREEIQPDNEMSSLLINLHDAMVSLVNDMLKFREERTDIGWLISETDTFCAKAENNAAAGHTRPEPDLILTEDMKAEFSEENRYAQTLPEEDLSLSEQPENDLDVLSEPEEIKDPPESPGKNPSELESFDLMGLEDLLSEELDGISAAQEKSGSPADAEDRQALCRIENKGAYEEEHDEELFNIFLDHLKENINHMTGILESGSQEKPVQTLLQCANILRSLRSSAAYMDYGELVNFYDTWSSQIESIIGKAETGSLVSFAFITDYMDQLIDHFSLSGQFGVLTVEKEPVHETVSPDEISMGVSQIKPDEDAVPYESLDEEELEPEKEEQAASMAVPDDEREQLQQQDESAGLFDELDAVFNTSRIEEEKETLQFDPFDEDIEDELSSLPTPSGKIDKKPVSQPVPEKTVQLPPEPLLEKQVQPEKTAVEPELEVEPEFEPELEPELEFEPEPELEFEPEPELEFEPERTTNETLKASPEVPVTKVLYDDHQATRVSKQTLRVSTDKIDKLMNQVGELVVNRASYAQLYYEMRDFQRQIRGMGLDTKEFKWIRDFTFRLSEATVAMGRVANDLQEGVMKIRMLPISQLFNRYPRLVRDLVHNTGKQVQLDIQGEDTELDKMVIEEIADPLVHIIRNAVDHGIETVEERQKKGKPAIGTVRLNAFHESNHVVIEIVDDGCGIDLQQIRTVAVEKGFFTREEVDRMRPKEVMSVIMTPGFSISETITTVSGRGVGMDVVKKNVEKLNGTIEIDSEGDKGTRILIKIPLTLAIINALLVRVGGEVFTIPLSVIEETLRITASEIYTIEGIEVIQLRDGVLSLLRLTDEFNKKSKSEDTIYEYVVVVNTGMRQVGLVVDSLIGQEEAVIKPLVDFLQERSGFSGATILGDGSVSLILDVYEMVNICMERQSSLTHGGEGFMGFSRDASTKRDNGPQDITIN